MAGTEHHRGLGSRRPAAVAAYEPSPDPAVLRSYVDDLGPWLAEEYTRVHGVRTPRP